MSYARAALALFAFLVVLQAAWLAAAVATAKLLRAPVREARLGTGPVLFRFRVAGVPFVVGPVLFTAFVTYGTADEPMEVYRLPVGAFAVQTLLPWLALIVPALALVGPGATAEGVLRGLTLLFRLEDLGAGFAAWGALLEASPGAAFAVPLTRLVGLNLLPLGSTAGASLVTRLLPERFRERYTMFSLLAFVGLLLRAAAIVVWRRL